MSIKTRLEQLEQRRAGEYIVVVVKPDEDKEAALMRVTDGEGEQGANVIFITGGLPG